MPQQDVPPSLRCADKLIEMSGLVPLVGGPYERVSELDLSVNIPNTLDVGVGSVRGRIEVEKAFHAVANCACPVFFKWGPLHLYNVNTAPEAAYVPATLSEKCRDAPFSVYLTPPVLRIHRPRAWGWLQGNSSSHEVLRRGNGLGESGHFGLPESSSAWRGILCTPPSSNLVHRGSSESEYRANRGNLPR
jgi:hypothetical protein